MIQKNTEGAKIFASNAEHSTHDVDANWWEVFSGYRLKQWQKELDLLTEKTGISLQDVCEYAGLAGNNGEIVFYRRLPHKRETFIGIGMAFGRQVHTINRWISKYGKKRALYAKEIEDLIWIYLIGAAVRDRDSGNNYFRMYDACADAVFRTYYEFGAEHAGTEVHTADLMEDLRAVPYDEKFEGLRAFVAEHLQDLRSAYAKPRRMLACHLDLILTSLQQDEGTHDCKEGVPLSSLRGYLDDSQINYLSGDPDTIYTMDRKGRESRTRKHIPKGRRSHISIALALGMGLEEIDDYLRLMGFTPLDAIDREEGLLINALKKWEDAHPLPGQLKLFAWQANDGKIDLTEEQKRSAASQMLRLRQDLNDEFTGQGIPFPYLNR